MVIKNKVHFLVVLGLLVSIGKGTMLVQLRLKNLDLVNDFLT